ncbi:hypothetical protein BHM03_00060814 [Ensete ventricosum]|nr:hypothetical protein BHM03_00060814 [Ensete ventricosum]
MAPHLRSTQPEVPSSLRLYVISLCNWRLWYCESSFAHLRHPVLGSYSSALWVWKNVRYNALHPSGIIPATITVSTPLRIKLYQPKKKAQIAKDHRKPKAGRSLAHVDC